MTQRERVKLEIEALAVRRMTGARRCDCAACSTGAGTCYRRMSDAEMLDVYGFDRAGNVRPVGKGRARHAEGDGGGIDAIVGRFVLP